MKSSRISLVMELINHDVTMLFSNFHAMYFGSSVDGAVAALVKKFFYLFAYE